MNFSFPVIHLNRVTAPAKTPFRDSIEQLLGQVNQLTGRRNRSSNDTLKKRNQAARLLIEALYRCFLSAHPHAAVVVPSSPRAFKYRDSDRVHVVGHKIADALVTAMLRLGWVKQTKGFRHDDVDIPTVIRPSGELLEIFTSTGHVWYPRPVPPTKDLVILKNYDESARRGYRIPEPENDTVRQMRSELNRINRFLGKQFIGLMVRNETFETIARRLGQWRTKDNQHIKPTMIDCQSVFLRRIFNRSSLKYGGRLYGGWWQSIPKEWRVHITINGLATCEVDFSALHPTLLYHREGIELPGGDLYDLDLPIRGCDSSPEHRLERRAIVKSFVNAKLNDERDEHQLSAEDQAMLGLSTAQLVRLLKEKMPPVTKYFGTKVGLELQRIDSDIAAAVLTRLLQKNIVCIAIHDSFIVDIRYRSELQQAMINAYLDNVGQAINFKAKMLFDNDATGHRITQPEFCMQFDSSGAPDLAATYKLLDDAWHTSMMISHSTYQEREHRSTPKKKEGEEKSRTTV